MQGECFPSSQGVLNGCVPTGYNFKTTFFLSTRGSSLMKLTFFFLRGYDSEECNDFCTV